MNYPKPYLQPYKGKSTRQTCPACQTKHSFTLYINGQTHELIHRTVGRCNREIKCGYHYTPKQFYADNCTDAMLGVSNKAMLGVSKSQKPHTPSPSGRVGVGAGEVPFSYLKNSLSPNSNFVSFLKNHFYEQQIEKVFENYLLGATKNKEVIFWQIDINGKIRTGKIMQHNPKTGKRIKHQSGAIDWVHNKLKKSGQLPENFNLLQCFFGEHLLKLYPNKQVAIVESEKSAIIASIIFPDFIWLAAGNLNGLSIEKCQALKGRNIMLYPDLGAYEKWSLKVGEIQKQCKCKASISTLLEEESTDNERVNGLDIADYIINELLLKFRIPQIQSCFSPSLQSMIDNNNAVLISKTN